MVDRNRYKLTKKELGKLVDKDIISEDIAIALKTASLKREPGKFAKKQDKVKFPFNPSGGSNITSINYYGGEHFGKPYCFLAEIVVYGSHDNFHRFLKEKGIEWILDRVVFTY